MHNTVPFCKDTHIAPYTLKSQGKTEQDHYIGLLTDSFIHVRRYYIFSVKKTYGNQTKMKQASEYNLKTILAIIERLRAPDGCMWDRQQNTKSVKRYLIEEAYEVLDAIDEGSPQNLKEELGDLLFQILFLVKISEEKGEFTISDVIREISEKMIRRHPHVFGNTRVKNVEEIKTNWNDIKIHKEGKRDKDASLLGGVPRSMPSLSKAQKITEKASTVGFDWKNSDGVIEKIEEELEELKVAIRSKKEAHIQDEIGDLIFSLVNVSRFVNVDAETALRSTIKKFIKRFSFIEAKLKEAGKDVSHVSLEEMDSLWNQSKNNIKE
jgi:tetrapyrrole methylase family protein/MazG family protein